MFTLPGYAKDGNNAFPLNFFKNPPGKCISPVLLYLYMKKSIYIPNAQHLSPDRDQFYGYLWPWSCADRADRAQFYGQTIAGHKTEPCHIPVNPEPCFCTAPV
jgi:hypothetical protein